MKPTHLYLYDALRTMIPERKPVTRPNPYAKGSDAFCTVKGPSERDMLADRVRAGIDAAVSEMKSEAIWQKIDDGIKKMRENDPYSAKQPELQAVQAAGFDPRLVYGTNPRGALWLMRKDGSIHTTLERVLNWMNGHGTTVETLNEWVSDGRIVPTTHPHPDYPPQQEPDWIEHDGKGFPAALKGVPPERVMLRTRGCGEGLASAWNTEKFARRFGYPWNEPWVYWTHEGGAFEVTHYRILPEVVQRQWSAWIPHEPGPCPIPGVKAGEYGVQMRSGCEHLIADAETKTLIWHDCGDGTITAFRILLPEGFTPHKGVGVPKEVPDQFEAMLDDGSVVPWGGERSWWTWLIAPKGQRRIIGWRKV